MAIYRSLFGHVELPDPVADRHPRIEGDVRLVRPDRPFRRPRRDDASGDRS